MLQDNIQLSQQPSYTRQVTIEDASNNTLFQLNNSKVVKKHSNFSYNDDTATYTIGCLNAKSNPDLIVPGGTLKGNMYFKNEKEAEPKIE